MKKVKFIYNPYAGNKVILEKLDNIIELYQDKNLIIIPYRIEKQKDVILALDDVNTEEYDHILIAGGDGTIDFVINAMHKKDIHMPIAILPVGTANDFAKFLEIPSDIDKACQKILERKYKEIDIGKINEKYFVNVASTGLFADVSQKTDLNLKNTVGKLAYYIKGLESLPNFKKIKISLTSKEVNFDGDIFLMLVFNGKTTGNIPLAINSDPQDGLLDVVIFKAMNVKEMIRLLVNIMKGEHIKSKNMIYFKTDELYIESKDNIETDIDGEVGPNFPLNIKCIKKGLKVFGI